MFKLTNKLSGHVLCHRSRTTIPTDKQLLTFFKGVNKDRGNSLTLHNGKALAMLPPHYGASKVIIYLYDYILYTHFIASPPILPANELPNIEPHTHSTPASSSPATWLVLD